MSARRRRGEAGGFRALTGPMASVTWAVAVGWLALAVACVLTLPTPWSLVIGAFAGLGAAATAWVAWGMRVRYDGARIVLPGRGETPWSEVARIELSGRVLTVPIVGLRVGRGIDEIPLDGLAWFGANAPRKLASTLAEAGGVGPVTRRERHAGGGRRAIR